MNRFTIILLVFFLLAAPACMTSIQPLHVEPVQPGLQSEAAASLQQMPPPKEKIVAAIYRFSDQTGQYKPSTQIASWSTAVTQGSASILIKAMDRSGWFIPIEREGLSNLLNERRIINSTRSQNNDNNMMPPLLFAGIILEGGIIGYDTNIITAGGGVRYFGAGVSGQFRKDQVTIYLRAVSTQTGRILKTVHTTKSILSKQIDGAVFRFVDSNRLIEAEAGYTFNEPPVMAVTEAIDEALKILIIEGVDDQLWSPLDREEFNSYKSRFTETQQAEKRIQLDYFGQKRNIGLRTGLSASAHFTYGSYIGSYAAAIRAPGVAMQLEQYVKPAFSVKLSAMRSEVGARRVFSEAFTSADILFSAFMTPDYGFSPYVGIGGGVLAYDTYKSFARSRFFPAATAEAGLDYRFSQWLGFRAGIHYRYLIKDGIDGVRLGTVHDQQWNLFTGLTMRPQF